MNGQPNNTADDLWQRLRRAINVAIDFLQSRTKDHWLMFLAGAVVGLLIR